MNKKNRIGKFFYKILIDHIKNELLIEELQNSNLISVDKAKSLQNNLAWQKKEIADLYHDMLFFEELSAQILDESLDKDNFFKKVKAKLIFLKIKLKIKYKFCI